MFLYSDQLFFASVGRIAGCLWVPSANERYQQESRGQEGRERGQSYHFPLPYSCSVLIVATSLCNFRTHTKSLLQNSSSLNSGNSIFSPHSFSSKGTDSFSLLLISGCLAFLVCTSSPLCK